MAKIDYDKAFRRAKALKATGTNEQKACLQAATEQGSENPKRDMWRLKKRLQRERPEAQERRKKTLALKREFRRLEYFIEHRGDVVRGQHLLDAVWGSDNLPHTRTVDMHIAKLRKKIEEQPSEPRFIVTVHKVGYKFLG